MAVGPIFDNENQLEKLDSSGYKVLDAILYDGPPPQPSLSNPHCFVCIDGNKYWLKAGSQYGLSSELIAGRIGHKLNAAPNVAIVNADPRLVVNIQGAGHLTGLLVGISNVPDSINLKDIPVVAPGMTFSPQVIDANARARAVAFHTWFGFNDTQLFVGLSNGKVTSADLGGCFADVSSPADPVLTVLDIPGIPLNHGSQRDCVNDAVELIESLTDDDILGAVAGMPAEQRWNSDRAHRLAIAKWLAERKLQVRKVLEQWT